MRIIIKSNYSFTRKLFAFIAKLNFHFLSALSDITVSAINRDDTAFTPVTGYVGRIHFPLFRGDFQVAGFVCLQRIASTTI
jgi:hypothetical protein